MYGEFVSAVCYIRFINAWAETPRLRATLCASVQFTMLCCFVVMADATLSPPHANGHAHKSHKLPQEVVYQRVPSRPRFLSLARRARKQRQRRHR